MPGPVTSSTQTAVDTPESLRAEIVAQGVAETATFEHLLGAGKDLWADDFEFERFLSTVQAVRAEQD